jgi:hypothetical protein
VRPVWSIRSADSKRFERWLGAQDTILLESNFDIPVEPPVIIVHLRCPRNDPDESRDDPFWEFGSFGCTGCHSSNLMHLARIHHVEGARFTFAQGGQEGFRLVKLTPPVTVVEHRDRSEVRWEPVSMPFRYIETFYNSERLHQTLNYKSPNQFEAKYSQQLAG